MPTAVVTGANRGIGLEFVRQYRAEGWNVIAVCRPLANADHARELGASIEPLDVTDLAAVQSLARRLAPLRIDLLVNNAGMNPGNPPLGSLDYGTWQSAFHLNVIAPLQVAEALFPLMSAGAVIANISSRQGSVSCNVEGNRYFYRATKAALNAITRSMAIDLRPRGILTVALHPGWVRTDMGGTLADIEATESVGGMKKVIGNLGLAESGNLINYDGVQIPW